MNKIVLIVVLCSFSLTSCNTLRQRPDESIVIYSNPSEAQIVVDGTYCGTTPAAIRMDPKYSHNIILQKEGYCPEGYTVQSKVCGTKLLSNGFFPIAGLVAGGVAALFMSSGYGEFALLMGLGIVVLGTAVGAGMGLLGTGVDLCSGDARSLSADSLNFQLVPAEGQY